MLAEERQREKWSLDPQNTNWSRDKNRFGYQLMKKMGWSDGKGLGAQEDGQVSHVKITKKDDTLGVGAKKSYNDVWIAHQDDFSAILSNLNNISGEKANSSGASAKKVSLESAVKKSRKKIMYSKFIKSKDLSRASANDMVGIFGPGSKSAPSSPHVQSEAEDEGNLTDGGSTVDLACRADTNNHGITTITSSCSMQDYFAQKYKALGLKNPADKKTDGEKTSETLDNDTNSDGLDSTNLDEGSRKLSKKKKKRKHDEDLCNIEEELVAPKEDELKPKKGKKSKRKDKDDSHLPLEVAYSNDVDGDSKKRQNKDIADGPVSAIPEETSEAQLHPTVIQDSDCIDGKKRKKKKKKKDKKT